MNTAFTQSLELMWKGMLSIFVVIAVIFIVTLIMTKIKRKKKTEEESKANQDGSDVQGNTGA